MSEVEINLEAFEDLNNYQDKIFENSRKNIYFCKKIQTKSQPQNYIAGIDEAGRGPVLGPMLMCCLYTKDSDEHILNEIGCRDSKQMSPGYREKVFDQICKHPSIGFFAHAISPCFITDGWFKVPRLNLNQISYDTSLELVRRVAAQCQIKTVYSDLIGPVTTHYNVLKTAFPKLEAIVEKKADSKYLTVSAASICAKVIRDQMLKNWKFEEKVTNREYGSGYPSDPMTINWLKNSFEPSKGFPSFVRINWQTCLKIMEDKIGCYIVNGKRIEVPPKIKRKRNFMKGQQKLKF